MANVEIENVFGIVDARHVQGDLALKGNLSGNIFYNDVTRLRSRLTTLNAAYYTSARLDKMTKNDLVYALRLADDPTSIK